jgi:hypothetical protein
MAFLTLLVCIGFLVGAIFAFCAAFVQDDKNAAGSPGDKKRFSFKWLCAGILAASLAVLLFVAVFMPAIVRERIVEAEDITRKTFREKLGRELDTVTFDSTNQQTVWDGWKYAGTVHVAGEVWDVTVTRSNNRSARNTTLQCEAVPREWSCHVLRTGWSRIAPDKFRTQPGTAADGGDMTGFPGFTTHSARGAAEPSR